MKINKKSQYKITLISLEPVEELGIKQSLNKLIHIPNSNIFCRQAAPHNITNHLLFIILVAQLSIERCELVFIGPGVLVVDKVYN